MARIALNGVVELNRGDTVTIPIFINAGTALRTILYRLKPCDTIYFALLEPHQKWEDAILKKTLDYQDFDTKNFCVPVHFYSEDTEYLHPGTYYYEIKLRKDPQNNADGFESVETLVPRTKFYIVE